jgi:dolichol-phosphate mannosyltransferase
MLAFSWTAATSFSTLPLRISMIFGAMVGVLGIEEGIRAALAHFLGWYTVPGWTSLTVLVSLIGSALLISIGILGEYVAKLYEESKGRPLYIVARTFGGRSPISSKAREWDAAVHVE